MNRGRFIVVEGLEGAGKTTAIETIKHYLQQNNVHNIIFTREPGGTYIGEQLRSLIKNTVPNEPLDKRSELLMMYTARVQLLETIIKPALAKGDWIIADRFELSTYAYQGGGRGISQAILDGLSDFCLGGLTPDLTLFLDIKPEEGLKRATHRGNMDRIEQESLDFFKRVYQAYHHKIQHTTNVRVIDAGLSLAEVQQMICVHLKQFLEENAYCS